MLRYEDLGGTEDWSCKFTNERGQSLCIIDTGGDYQVINDLELYTVSGRTGNHPKFGQYRDAVAYVEDALRLQPHQEG